jgi:hypothetical protein
MRPNVQQFPSFASLDELVEFFDTHDMGEYEGDLPEAHFEVDVQRKTHLIASLLELLKLELSKKGTIHRLRMEKEFETLTLAWDALAKLQFATEQLFPSGLQPRLEGDQRRIQVEETGKCFLPSVRRL